MSPSRIRSLRRAGHIRTRHFLLSTQVPRLLPALLQSLALRRHRLPATHLSLRLRLSTMGLDQEMTTSMCKTRASALATAVPLATFGAKRAWSGPTESGLIPITACGTIASMQPTASAVVWVFCLAVSADPRAFANSCLPCSYRQSAQQRLPWSRLASWKVALSQRALGHGARIWLAPLQARRDSSS